MPNNLAETALRSSEHAVLLLTAARHHFHSPPESPQTCGRVNLNLNDYHSEPMVISTIFCIPDISDWWRQQEETHSKYTNLTNVGHNIFSIILHGVGVETSISLVRDVIGRKQSKTTRKTHRDKVVVWQRAWVNNEMLVGDDAALDTRNIENDLEMKIDEEDRKLHRMAKIHHLLEMWQCNQILYATQKESRTQYKQMTAVGYTSDTEEIVKASCLLFKHDDMAAFKLPDRSSLPPALSEKDLPGGRTQVLIICLINRIDHHPTESDDDSTPQSILGTQNQFDWNCNLDNTNFKQRQLGGWHWILNRATQWPRECGKPRAVGCECCTKCSEIDLATTEVIDKCWNWVANGEFNGNEEEYGKQEQVGQNLSICLTWFFIFLDQEFNLEIYYGRMVSSHLWILVDEQVYSRRNEWFSRIYKCYQYESEQCKNIAGLSFATGSSFNQ